MTEEEKRLAGFGRDVDQVITAFAKRYDNGPIVCRLLGFQIRRGVTTGSLEKFIRWVEIKDKLMDEKNVSL